MASNRRFRLPSLSAILAGILFRIDITRMEVNHTMSVTYNLMKRIIEKGGYDRESTLLKLDVFLMADRISPEEYAELTSMIGGVSE